MALLELHKEMLKKPPSSPLSNYIFRVNFHLDSIYKDKSLGYSLNNDTEPNLISKNIPMYVLNLLILNLVLFRIL